jgi:hypothetical protein
MATGMQLIDIGVNLTHRRFDKDRSAVLARAHTAGVTRMILTGTSAAAADLAAGQPGVLLFWAGIEDAVAATPAGNPSRKRIGASSVASRRRARPGDGLTSRSSQARR